ncbi:efflux RND transporter periplasmic adaptor subunit [Palleronia caenipelagi]|uniref:Efflux RND transporter periplasmic adaptor subunit n=1 Tax=Palleronia caenipelagi TaxID=2489174 RepID=A0A547Q354_9RHOB|nr:efflux RND transporter periplasmic adaptor subunit [Palleronia caenipelagi]TRD20801.1 efflux RND transporter periplasmic adaptor subunit [Palleronia caenipelagi]
MRLVSLITALIVAASLYFFVFERNEVLDFAGAAPAVEEVAAEVEAPEERRGVSVVAVRSVAQPVGSEIILRGRTEAARRVEVRAETTGRVISEPLRKGARVAEGDVLCRIDPGTRASTLAEQKARLAEAEAARPGAEARLIEAKARLIEAEINQNAATKLSDRGFASQTRVASSDAAAESARAAIQAAEGGLQSIEAQVSSARAAVAAAETEIDRLTITAPFGGLLESDTSELGALLQAGGTCAEIIQLDPIKLVGFVPELSVSKVTLGAEASGILSGGREVSGQVTFLSRSADPDTRTFRTEIEIPNPEQRLRDGETVEITISSDGTLAHLLPQSALTLNDMGEMGVRLVTEADEAGFVPVTVLRDTRQGVYLAGLPEQAQVIVVGQEFVSDGVPLEVTLRELPQ